ncbi:AraC family transcriptional regulator ['Paenibacillus yunnanensis' Narsing Rao et al. 2020]|uniref:AraC family transcriptional regulator n=1 Tax=Paenibacillus tengchongensis TaxID=2608684 RepID=UPI00124F05CE|nr:AraC family transcriptional regulator [Paenibacillus tengchongensis]
MKNDSSYGIYGFRFSEPEHLPLLNLFAAGHEAETHSSYHWDGLERSDGPLLLFQYTMSGAGIFESGGERQRIGPGRAFLAEIPGDHRYYHPGDGEAWEFYFLLFRPKLILPIWEEIKQKLGQTPLIDPASPPIRLMRDIVREAREGRITDAYIASSLLYPFMMELGRLASGGMRHETLWPPAVKEAVRFMDAHYAEMIGQDELARRLGVSKFHLLRTFSKHVGLTPNDYLNRIRIERSVELLRTTDLSIEAIAGQVGYSTGSYLIKVFHKLTGQTPGAFRSGTGSLHYNRLYFD